MVSRGNKTAADGTRLFKIFKIHPATVLRLLAREPCPKTEKYQAGDEHFCDVRHVDSSWHNSLTGLLDSMGQLAVPHRSGLFLAQEFAQRDGHSHLEHQGEQ
jgi:hypothetical protein